MSGENSHEKGWQHARVSMLKTGIGKWKEEATMWGKSEEVGVAVSTQADEDWNSGSGVGFFDTHLWWMSKALQSKNRKCTMTHQFPVLRQRDESKYDSRAWHSVMCCSLISPSLHMTQPGDFEPLLSPLHQCLVSFQSLSTVSPGWISLDHHCPLLFLTWS